MRLKFKEKTGRDEKIKFETIWIFFFENGYSYVHTSNWFFVVVYFQWKFMKKWWITSHCDASRSLSVSSFVSMDLSLQKTSLFKFSAPSNQCRGLGFNKEASLSTYKFWMQYLSCNSWTVLVKFGITNQIMFVLEYRLCTL